MFTLSNQRWKTPFLFIIGFSACVFLNSSLIAQRVPNATGSLKVLAVMVEFKADENEYTSGNGTFAEGSLPYMQNNEIRIDPLPHDQSYFEAHLTFAQNWYRRASANQLNIDFYLAPTIYQLDQEMAAYSPTGENFTFEPLGSLVNDVWNKVDAGPALDLPWTVDDETALIIFHAGVGRDIELIGTILDKTYQDIPSIYLGVSTLEGFSDNVIPSNFTIKNGSIPVTNSLIIPRTLTRRGELFQEEQVVSFSINGLLIASLASHMGLPDLFNTETGESAIGQFGLMDGAGFILSYNGLFPPLPSAWERIQLGWEQAEVINTREAELIDLPAISLNESNAVKQYSISDTEYFLFENRHRDARSNGVELTYRLPNGQIQSQRFTNQDSTFAGQYADFDSLLIRGVLIDVDNPDFALPGGLDYGTDQRPGTEDDRELNGGILIWHIDESIIENQPNAINADLKRRGVDLEEADGAQDIGNPIQGSLANVSSGHAYDFWWQGNDYRVITEIDTLRNYQNRFGDDTRPNTKNNAGGSTSFEAYSFSPNLAQASFRFRTNKASNWITNLESINLPVIDNSEAFPQEYLEPTVPLSFTQIGDTRFITTFVGQQLFLIEQSPSSTTVHSYEISDSILQTLIRPSSTEILLIKRSNDTFYSTAELIEWTGTTFQQKWSKEYDEQWKDLGKEARIFRIEGNQAVTLWNERIIDLETGILQGESPSKSVNFSNGTTLFIDETILSRYGFEYERLQSIVKVNDGSEELLALNDAFRTTIIDQDGLRLSDINPISQTDEELANQTMLAFQKVEPAFSDLNKDGATDIIRYDPVKNQLVAYNLSGSIIAGFPIELDAYDLRVNGALLLFEDEIEQIHALFEARDAHATYLTSINLSNGRMTEGFPFNLGSISYSKDLKPDYALDPQNGLLQYQTGLNEFKQIEHLKIQRPLWASAFGNNPNLDFSYANPTSQQTSDTSNLLNVDETYNWPNPASTQTTIRYQSQKGAEISIVVAQPSGKIILRDKTQAQTNQPESLDIMLSNWPSGVYLAKVQASLNGESRQKIIKMVVVN